MTEVTRILTAIESGDPKAADNLLPLVYKELRRQVAQKMSLESPGQTLQPTALVLEHIFVLLVHRPETGTAELIFPVLLPRPCVASLETLPGDWQVGYNSLMVNPGHHMIVSRDHSYRDYYYATKGTQDIPFVARHFFDHDLAEENRTRPFPSMERSHFSWSGDGSYFLLGNGQMRGKKRDQQDYLDLGGEGEPDCSGQ